FRVLRTVLAPREVLLPREQLFLATYARITGYTLPAGGPQLIDPQSVAIEGAHQRKRLMQLAGIAALLSRPVKPCSGVYLRMLSWHLETKDTVVDVVDAVQKGHRVRARLLAMRRTMKAMLKEAWLAEGVRGIARFIGALFFKAPVNGDKHWNYKRLG